MTIRPILIHPEPKLRKKALPVTVVSDQMLRLADDMVETMYADVPAFLHPAAQRSVLSHMVHLTEIGEVRCDGIPTLKSEYRLGK